jgi:putative DNA primase/helicase
MERERYTPPTERVTQLKETIPTQLQKLPQWVLWKYEGPEGTKRKKPPFTTDGRRASVSNPKSWTTFTEAIRTYTQWGGYEGLGLMLTKDLTVIDLDNCLDRDGKPNQQAQQIIQSAGSYTEISPSGKGLHVFLLGNVPGTARRRGAVEMYDSSRYITITGQRFLDTPTEIRADQGIINQIHTKFIRPPDVTRSPRTDFSPPLPVTDQQVIEKALRAKNGAKFQQLWEGNRTSYQSASEAHIATAAMLAYWTNGDPNQMDRLFRQSGQFDEETAKKWDERHRADGKTYGQLTIDKAVDTRRTFTKRSPKHR